MVLRELGLMGSMVSCQLSAGEGKKRGRREWQTRTGMLEEGSRLQQVEQEVEKRMHRCWNL